MGLGSRGKVGRPMVIFVFVISSFIRHVARKAIMFSVRLLSFQSLVPHPQLKEFENEISEHNGNRLFHLHRPFSVFSAVLILCNNFLFRFRKFTDCKKQQITLQRAAN